MRARSSKWLLGALPLLVGLGFAAVGCSSDEDAASSRPDDSIGNATTEQTTTSTALTTTTEPVAATNPGLDAEAAALETWTRVLDAAKTGTPNDDQIAVIESLASRNTAEQLKDFFPEAAGRELDHYPQLTMQDDGTVAIDDCIIMNRGISTGVSNWFLGSAEPNPDSPTGWIINSLQLINLDPCVPRSLAEAAIQGYEDHWDARDSYLNPPNLNSPELQETTTGVYRDLLAGLVDRFTRDTQRLVGRPATSPQFWEINSAAEIVIIDCQEADPDRGVYDMRTGDRTDLIPAIRPGQLDFLQSTLVLEGERWKVSDVQAQTNLECRDGDQPKPLQIAGG